MRTAVLLSLIIDGTASDATEVIERLLDNGVFQDPINQHDLDGCGSLHVVSASIVLAEELAQVKEG
jgi:hypothetical protein